VLYGSLARGDEDAGSDLDLLVSLAEDRPLAAVKLAVLLERTLGRDVDVARLNRVKDTAPLLLLQALDEGRVRPRPRPSMGAAARGSAPISRAAPDAPTPPGSAALGRPLTSWLAAGNDAQDKRKRHRF